MTRTAWAEATHQLRLDGHHQLAEDLEQEIHQLYQRLWNRQEPKSNDAARKNKAPPHDPDMAK